MSWGSFGLVWSAGAVLSVLVDDAAMDLKRLLSLYLMHSWTSWRAGQLGDLVICPHLTLTASSDVIPSGLLVSAQFQTLIPLVLYTFVTVISVKN